MTTVTLDKFSASKCPGKECGGSAEGDIIKALRITQKNLRSRRRAVYGILCFQLLWAAGIITLFSLHNKIKSFLRSDPGKWGFGVVAAGGIVLLLVVMFSKDVRKKSPHNWVILGMLTIIYELVMGAISTVYDPNVMVMAAVILSVIAVGLAGLAIQTKFKDLRVGHGIICCCLVVMSIFAISFNFIHLPQLTLMKKLYACWGALAITMYFTGLLVSLLQVGTGS